MRKSGIEKTELMQRDVEVIGRNFQISSEVLDHSLFTARFIMNTFTI